MVTLLSTRLQDFEDKLVGFLTFCRTYWKL